MSAITLCLRDPALRAAGLVMALQGAIACSFGPYFSTLAVHSFGFGDRGYAVLLVLSSLVSVSASVIGGIRADMIKAGVIDPVKVVRGALENAASIAAMILTTDVLITDVPAKENAPAMPPGGMGGMDY